MTSITRPYIETYYNITTDIQSALEQLNSKVDRNNVKYSRMCRRISNKKNTFYKNKWVR